MSSASGTEAQRLAASIASHTVLLSLPQTNAPEMTVTCMSWDRGQREKNLPEIRGIMVMCVF